MTDLTPAMQWFVLVILFIVVLKLLYPKGEGMKAYFIYDGIEWFVIKLLRWCGFTDKEIKYISNKMYIHKWYG